MATEDKTRALLARATPGPWTIPYGEDQIAFVRHIRRSAEAYAKVAAVTRALRGSEHTKRRPQYECAFADDTLLGDLFDALDALDAAGGE